jgi:putative nucleotidyltransferase with HDIG domain
VVPDHATDVTAQSERDPHDLRGLTLGSYRLVTELGRGGMGSVWYAEHAKIGRRAAIKVLRPELTAYPELVDRFVAEARAVNAIRHPNIVEINDFGETTDLRYLVMEFLEGETLGARLERAKTLELDAVVRIVNEMALALAAAHERRIVHRDLKPENVFLCAHDDYPDRVKLLDFGIAKLLPNGGAMGGTMPGVAIGTPAYMSPEQCLGDATIDHRSDIYSLGIVAYEMLVGEPPFVAETFGRFVIAHTTTKPAPPYEQRSSIGRRVSDVIMKALEKRSEDRFESVRELAEELAAAAKGKSEPKVDPTHVEAVEREQSREVGRALHEIVLKRFESGKLELPSMPTAVFECIGMLDRGDSDPNAIAAALERDPLAATRVLKLTNSPVHGGRLRVSSLKHAVSRLGIRPLRTLLVQLSARQVFQSRDLRIRRTFERLWAHAVAVGSLSRELGARIGGVDPDTAYLAGLLHDVGKPVVGAFLLEAERQLLDELGAPWMPETLWLKTVESAHHEIGRSLSSRWGLPDEVRDAIDHAADAPDRSVYGDIVAYADALSRLEGLDAGTPSVDEATRGCVIGRNRFRVSEAEESALTHRLHERVEEWTGLSLRRT